jgi:hypothetical protein
MSKPPTNDRLYELQREGADEVCPECPQIGLGFSHQGNLGRFTCPFCGYCYEFEIDPPEEAAVRY